jgi:hypothetical protein
MLHMGSLARERLVVLTSILSGADVQDLLPSSTHLPDLSCTVLLSAVGYYFRSAYAGTASFERGPFLI